MKKITEEDKIGIFILLLNVTLCLFILSNDWHNIVYVVVGMCSTIIATAFNIYYIIKTKKKTINIVSLIFEIILLIGLIVYLIKII